LGFKWAIELLLKPKNSIFYLDSQILMSIFLDESIDFSSKLWSKVHLYVTSLFFGCFLSIKYFQNPLKTTYDILNFKSKSKTLI